MTEITGTLQKITLASTAELSPQAGFGDGARPLLAQPMPVKDFLGRLLAAGLYDDAVKLMAHALPKREAVWWACLAARTLLEQGAEPVLLAAVEAAEAWVYKPNEANRRMAMNRATASGMKHPAAWAAVAASWSGGSMAPPDAPVVPPADHLAALAVVGAVSLSAVMREPEHKDQKLRFFLDQAVDIANGGTGRIKAA